MRVTEKSNNGTNCFKELASVSVVGRLDGPDEETVEGCCEGTRLCVGSILTEGVSVGTMECDGIRLGPFEGPCDGTVEG